MSSIPVFGEDADGASTKLEALVRLAIRQGSTPERKAQKEAAFEALVDQGAASLRFVMSIAHCRNSAVHVLLDQLVTRLPEKEYGLVWVDFLESPHPKTRKFAAYYLGFYDTPDLAPQLLPLLGDEEAAGAAIRTLGKWKIRDAVPEIVGFLEHPKERWRVAAANALRDIEDDRAVPALFGALDDPVFTVRNTAERALGSLGHEADEMTFAVSDDAKGPLLRHTVRIMGIRKARHSIPPLQHFLEDDDWAVRGDAARALLAIDPEEAPAWLAKANVASDHPYVRAALAEIAGPRGLE